MLFFLALSILGFALCLALHVSTFAGYAGDWSQPIAIGLFLGVFPVVIAAIAAKAATPRGVDSEKLTFEVLEQGAPIWARWLVRIAFAYTVVNFIVFVATEQGTPTREPGGGLSLRSKGKLVRSVTPEEFRRHQGLQARGMSGHCFAFYAMAGMTFFGMRNVRLGRCELKDLMTPDARLPSAATDVSHASGLPAATLLDYGRAQPRLPVWVHLMLFVGTMMTAWLGTPAVVAGLMSRTGQRVPIPLAIFGFFGGAVGGVAVVNYLFRCVIPARCPSCAGRTYCKSISKPTRYVCRDCGYEHKTA